MAVHEFDWDFSKRGQEDVARHQKKVRDIIRENIADVISEESIITRKKGQTVRIPIKGIKTWQFIYGKPKQGNGGYGLGHGSKGQGDVIGRRPAQQDEDGEDGAKGRKAGDQPGDDYLETEVDLDELIAMMMDDLQLPDLRRKEVAENLVTVGWSFNDIEKHGLKANLDKRRSFREALKRGADALQKLATDTGKSEAMVRQAWNHAKGDFNLALEFLLRPDAEIFLSLDDESARAYIQNQDLRYRVVKEEIEPISNAVILAMMDVSGSMSTQKKYLARSFYFWMVQFLKHKYRTVDIRFIAHTTEAKLVDEDEFFHKGESGGTVCASAYDLATDLITSDYSPSRWNIYGFHFSDGEDWDASRTMQSVKRLLDKGPNMLGYGEIRTEAAYGQQLMRAFEENFNLDKFTSWKDSDFEYFLPQRTEIPLVGCILKEKAHVYPALKVLFSRDKKV